ncbi:MAG: hypothetical protein AAGI54_05000 [Planctomycetota bacterium]
MIKLGCLLIVVLLIAIPVVAAQFLPWWAVLLIVMVLAGVLIFGLPKLIGYGFKRFFVGLFEGKSRVLRGAEVIVHEVAEVPRPASLDAEEREDVPDEDGEAFDTKEGEDDDELARYVMIDCTITPKPSTGKFQHWEPSELQLCPYDKSTKLDLSGDDDPTDAEDEGHVVECSSVGDATSVEDDDDDGAWGKYHGPMRLRLVFGCPESLVGRTKLRYYFEGIGDIRLP